MRKNEMMEVGKFYYMTILLGLIMLFVAYFSENMYGILLYGFFTVVQGFLLIAHHLLLINKNITERLRRES